jgi:hypothetical protein
MVSCLYTTRTHNAELAKDYARDIQWAIGVVDNVHIFAQTYWKHMPQRWQTYRRTLERVPLMRHEQTELVLA